MSSQEESSGKFIIIGLFAAAILGVFAFIFLRGGRDDKTKPNAEVVPSAVAAPAPADQTQIRFVYGTEKKLWLEEAVAGFQRENPAIVVELVGQGSLDSVKAILDGTEKPTLLSPADFISLNLLSTDYKQKYGTDIVPQAGDDAPQPLVLTPLVLVAWEDRGKLLDKDGSGVTWERIREVVSSNKGWPAVGGQADWGFVKLGHTNPTRSNSGLQALILMAYAVHDKRSGLNVGDILDDKFQDFLKSIEKGVPQFGESTGTFMTDMVLYGPSKYDVVVSYENLAIQHIPNAQGRWGNLRIFYPKQTMWSSHPAAVLSAPWVTAAQKSAAKKLIGYLLSKPVQQAALKQGFRPADPSIPVVSGPSPFKDAQAFGVKLDIPPVVEPPPGPVVRNLMELWSRLIVR